MKTPDQTEVESDSTQEPMQLSFAGRDLVGGNDDVALFTAPSNMPIKSDIESLSTPWFALAAAADARGGKPGVRTGKGYEVHSGPKGEATQSDRELWVFLVSKAAYAHHSLGLNPKRLRITGSEFLEFAGRSTCGRGYRYFADALDRLASTRLVSFLVDTQDRLRRRSNMGLLQDLEVYERKHRGQSIFIDVELPDRVIEQIIEGRILTLTREYFKIRSALVRRVYEVVRRHCGSQVKWHCNIDAFQEKTGSRAEARKFAFLMRKLAADQMLPDYELQVIEKHDGQTGKSLHIAVMNKNKSQEHATDKPASNDTPQQPDDQASKRDKYLANDRIRALSSQLVAAERDGVTGIDVEAIRAEIASLQQQVTPHQSQPTTSIRPMKSPTNNWQPSARDVETQAKPGESYDQVRMRLIREHADAARKAR